MALEVSQNCITRGTCSIPAYSASCSGAGAAQAAVQDTPEVPQARREHLGLVKEERNCVKSSPFLHMYTNSVTVK